MNKLEYLGQLEAILKKRHLSKAEIDDIIRDYAEFFEEGRRQGQSDAEISAKLGSPELIAEQLTEENPAANTTSAPKAEFKMPEVKLPKFNFEKKEKEPKAPKEPKIHYEKTSNMGCLTAAFTAILKACFLCIAIPTLAVCFGMAACSLLAVILGLLALAVCVLLGFGMAAVATHFLTLPVTLFAIFACITLIALLICLGALTSECLLWCCKFFGQLLTDLLRPKQVVVVNPLPVPQPYAAAPAEETDSETMEEEVEIDE